MIALRFAREGADVAFTDLSRDENMETLEKELSELGVKGRGYVSDASNFDEAQKVIDQVIDDFEKVDILVNNAGITRDGLIMRMKEEDWDAVININLKSAFNCIKAVSTIMVKQRSGRIISLASVVGVMGNPGQANYVASKAGMIGLTKTVAKELGSRGITVNAVAPGFIDTDMTAVLPDKAKEAMLSMIPLQRAGTPQDVADAITFLASDSAAYITGQVIHVTGGMYM